MKKYFIYALTAIAALSFTGCSEEALETTPTNQVSGSGMFNNATAALVPLNGIYRLMYTQGWSTTGNTQQCDGLTAWNLCAEVMGDDLIMGATGSGWYWYDFTYDVKDAYTSGAWRSYDLWNGYYTLISNANYIIAAEKEMEGTPSEVNYVIGQAYAIRAYCYHMLAQFFSRPYIKDDANRLREKCVPLYTEPTAAGTEGAPRASIDSVYAQVRRDIDKAVAMLKDAPAQTHKSHIDYCVANGIKARICSVTGEWDEVLTASKEAQANYSIGSAGDILSGLNSVKLPNVMWGAEIISDQAPGWGPIHYHMDALSLYMIDETEVYGFSAPKNINLELYAKMGAKDVRRGWWLSNEQLASEYNVEIAGANMIQNKIRFSDPSLGIGDKMWMRVEEMYLSEAEALCRLGRDAEAQVVLNKLVQTRDADYDCSAKTGTEMGALTSDYTGSLLEEIIVQRRIELWGEFGRVFDIRRLGQGFKRTAAQGYTTNALILNTDVNDPNTWAWVLTIPQKEFDGNKNLNQIKDQNYMGVKGQPEDLSSIYAY